MATLPLARLRRSSPPALMSGELMSLASTAAWGPRLFSVHSRRCAPLLERSLSPNLMQDCRVMCRVDSSTCAPLSTCPSLPSVLFRPVPDLWGAVVGLLLHT